MEDHSPSYREAEPRDIPQMMNIRMAVRENRLNNPSLVTEKDCGEFLFHRGKGWVCDLDGNILGFAIADLKDENIWALFIHPDHAGQGIGKTLHEIMMDWYFDQGKTWVWLGTAPGTIAEKFYKSQGWTAKGLRPNGEIRFEMTLDEWKQFLNKE